MDATELTACEKHRCADALRDMHRAGTGREEAVAALRKMQPKLTQEQAIAAVHHAFRIYDRMPFAAPPPPSAERERTLVKITALCAQIHDLRVQKAAWAVEDLRGAKFEAPPEPDFRARAETLLDEAIIRTAGDALIAKLQTQLEVMQS